MRDYEQSVRGYRITGDPPKPDKRFNYDYMQQTPEQVKAHEGLTVLDVRISSRVTPCLQIMRPALHVRVATVSQHASSTSRLPTRPTEFTRALSWGAD
jgi:hypothetical protein